MDSTNIKSFAEQIKRTVRMIEVCDMYGIRVGTNHKARCPFHDDTTASMHIYPDVWPRKHGFHCFACGANGSVIDFVMRLNGISLTESISKLNEDFNLGLDLDSQANVPSLAGGIKTTEREMELLRLNELRSDYDNALSLWVSLDRISRDQHPNVTGKPSLVWLEAMSKLPEAEYNLSVVSGELSLFEHELKGLN